MLGPRLRRCPYAMHERPPPNLGPGWYEPAYATSSGHLVLPQLWYDVVVERGEPRIQYGCMAHQHTHAVYREPRPPNSLIDYDQHSIWGYSADKLRTLCVMSGLKRPRIDSSLDAAVLRMQTNLKRCRDVAANAVCEGVEQVTRSAIESLNPSESLSLSSPPAYTNPLPPTVEEIKNNEPAVVAPVPNPLPLAPVEQGDEIALVPNPLPRALVPKCDLCKKPWTSRPPGCPNIKEHRRVHQADLRAKEKAKAAQQPV